MRYLKLFNESNDTFEDELQEFCDNNLAYLIDMGFKVMVTNYYGHDSHRCYQVKLYRAVKGSYVYYNWDDINDDFIPFLTILNEKYIITEIKMDYMFNSKKAFRKFKLNTILKDKVSVDKIDFIFIQIKKPS
jgi:hypothetical protein